MSNLLTTKATHFTCAFECIYIRETTDGFALICQRISVVGADFSMEEQTLLFAPTPHPLLDAYRTGAVWELLPK